MTFHTRKDKQCKARIMADCGDKLLIESKWGKDNKNILFVSKDYFETRYGIKN